MAASPARSNWSQSGLVGAKWTCDTRQDTTKSEIGQKFILMKGTELDGVKIKKVDLNAKQVVKLMPRMQLPAVGASLCEFKYFLLK